MGQILAVVSGKGGTGKTSLCAAVACRLAELGQKVLCIDADVGLRNLDISLGMSQEPVLPFTAVMDGEIDEFINSFLIKSARGELENA